MDRYRKRAIGFLCILIIVSMFWGCSPETKRIPNIDNNNNFNTPRDTDRNTNMKNFEHKISASYERADMSIAKVMTQTLDIRSGPGNNFPVIGRVTSNDKLNVYGKADDWYIVKLPNKASIGCVESKFLKPFSENQGSKQIPNVPSPTLPNIEAPNVPGIPSVPGSPGAPITGPGSQGNPLSPGTQPPNTTTPTPPTNKPGTTPNEDSSGTGVMTGEEKRILELCNIERSKIGAGALKANNDLTKLSRMKSKDIVDKNYFSHQSPTYGSPFDMMTDHGIDYMYAGENLAQNSTADRAFNAWMNSEGHRKNILNPNFTELGVGIAPKNDGSFVYTQLFIGK